MKHFRRVIPLVAIFGTLAGGAAYARPMVKPGPPPAPPPPVVIVPPPPPQLEHNEVAAFALVDQSRRAPTNQEAIALLKRAVAMVPEPGTVRGDLVCTMAARMMAVWSENKGQFLPPETLAAGDECYRLLPDVPMAQMLSGAIKIDAGQVRQGGRLILAAIKAQPRLALQADIPGTQRMLRQIAYSGDIETLDELKVALVQVGFGKDDPSFFGNLAIGVMAAQVANHDNDKATELLPQILDPDIGLRLLIDRRFEPIWPLIEQWAGSNLTRQRDAKLAAAQANFKLDADLKNRRVLADTLWSSGQRDAAMNLLKQAIDNVKLWDKDRFHITMLTVRYARMLNAQNRSAEAIEIARRVNAANPVSQFPYAANLMPNLAQMLIAQGQYQQALDLIDREYPPTSAVEDRAAFGYYSALRFCAYRRMGKTTEADRQSNLINQSFATNGGARSIRDGCMVEPATARQYLIANLMNEDTRDSTLLQFYRLRLNIDTFDVTSDMAPARELLQDKAVLAAVEGFGRDLPDSYLPALKMWTDK